MTTVYLAGPMTGYRNHNFDAFHRAAAHLRAKGYAVVNPAELDGDTPHEELREIPHWVFMRRDIRALMDCDLIYLLPGWTHSKGASLEARVAQGVGIDRLEDADTETWRTFEGEPEPEPVDAVMAEIRNAANGGGDFDFIVDDTLPPNTLRIESGPHAVEFDVRWEGHEMWLTPKAALDALDERGTE